MALPEKGTQEYEDLAIETGGGSTLPGFNYEAHVAATSGSGQVDDASGSGQVDDSSSSGQVDDSSGSGQAIGSSGGMPKKGTQEYEDLAKETGGGSTLPGFNYEAHIAATSGSGQAIGNSGGMPKKGTQEYEDLAKETGGGSTLPGFDYEAHIAATSGLGQAIGNSVGMPKKGTQAYEDLAKETGGGSTLPGFDYEAHIAATSGSGQVIGNSGGMPKEGTQEYEDLAKETGGGSTLPGFDYEAHVAATSFDKSEKVNRINANKSRELFIEEPQEYNRKSIDKIINFKPSRNVLEIDKDSLGIDGSATFASAKSKRVAKRKLASQDFDFIYDRKKGCLYFNENGTEKGFGDGGIIAILKGSPDLTFSNFDFI